MISRWKIVSNQSKWNCLLNEQRSFIKIHFTRKVKASSNYFTTVRSMLRRRLKTSSVKMQSKLKDCENAMGDDQSWSGDLRYCAWFGGESSIFLRLFQLIKTWIPLITIPSFSKTVFKQSSERNLHKDRTTSICWSIIVLYARTDW